MPHRQPAHVGFVDDCVVPGDAGGPVPLPVEAPVDHHPFRYRWRAVLLVEGPILLRIADRRTGYAAIPSRLTGERPARGVDPEFARIMAKPGFRFVRPVHPGAVELPGLQIGHVAGPDEARDLREGDAIRLLRYLGFGEEAQLHLRRVPREEGEVDPLAIPGCS